MEDFQREMNENRDKSRRTKWEGHRNQVSGLFHDVFSKKASVDKIAIFGAGNCDDLELNYLASNCNSIYLFDLDVESMKRGTQYLLASTRNKIKLVELDVTGLKNIDFEHHLSSLLKCGEKVESILQYVRDIEKYVVESSKDEWADFLDSFDLVASSAIYTQLFYNWALDTLSQYETQYNKEELEQIKEGFLDLRDSIILAYHDSIFKCCKTTGFVITWTDILKMEPEYIDTIKQGPNAIFALASNIGYGAALIAVKDFIENANKADFSLKYWPWDFNEEKQYLTMGLLGKLNR
ncbi:hypothetical protein [Peribacillus asahii]|uniref:hypothetical protein n=1 Tax=Peribacillus asahii TaxID=228899 RepID=UPI00207AA263|nr:hypothetical protein [Peribacillus asahii]USK72009.1 hypothetical protein LIS76_09760 [Peribacillus asahii]